MEGRLRWILLSILFATVLEEGVARLQVSTVEVMTSERLGDLMSGEWMVEFYAPWCPACKQFTDTWERFADWAADKRSSLRVAKVDVTQETISRMVRCVCTSLSAPTLIWWSTLRVDCGARQSPSPGGGPPPPHNRGDGGCSPTPEDELRRRNAMLQGRVQLLQEHNLRLENCISQLKVIATLQQSSRQSRLRPLPSQPKSHPSPRPPPLPSRAIPTDTYDVPPSHGNSETYDVPPSHDTLYDIPPNMPADYEIPPNLNNSAQLYSVPVATRRTSSPVEIYSVPKSNQNVSTSELYSVPTGARKTSSPEVYSVPPSRGITRSPELYSVPPSRGKSSPQLYSVPPSNRRTATPTELYDVPPTKNNASKHPSSISPRPPVLRGSQGGMETYSIPPPRLLSAQPNPEIPPPRLPRRINTAPSSGTNKSSSFL